MAVDDLLMGPDTYGAKAESLPRSSLVARIRGWVEPVAAFGTVGTIALPIGAGIYHVGLGLALFGALCLFWAWVIARGVPE